MGLFASWSVLLIVVCFPCVSPKDPFAVTARYLLDQLSYYHDKAANVTTQQADRIDYLTTYTRARFQLMHQTVTVSRQKIKQGQAAMVPYIRVTHQRSAAIEQRVRDLTRENQRIKDLIEETNVNVTRQYNQLQASIADLRKIVNGHAFGIHRAILELYCLKRQYC